MVTRGLKPYRGEGAVEDRAVQDAPDVGHDRGGGLAGEDLLEMPAGEAVLPLEEEGAGGLQVDAHEVRAADEDRVEGGDGLVEEGFPGLGLARAPGGGDGVHGGAEQGFDAEIVFRQHIGKRAGSMGRRSRNAGLVGGCNRRRQREHERGDVDSTNQYTAPAARLGGVWAPPIMPVVSTIRSSSATSRHSTSIMNFAFGIAIASRGVLIATEPPSGVNHARIVLSAIVIAAAVNATDGTRHCHADVLAWIGDIAVIVHQVGGVQHGARLTGLVTRYWLVGIEGTGQRYHAVVRCARVRHVLGHPWHPVLQPPPPRDCRQLHRREQAGRRQVRRRHRWQHS